MKQEVKDEWVTALRSGDYKQGEGKLRQVLDDNTEAYCCLGVLCEIAVKHQVIPPAELDGNNARYVYGKENGYSGQGAYLPSQVVAWAELHSDEPRVELPGDVIPSLVHLNDTGCTFDQIADVVEYL